jgi:hypothetical protein
MITTLATPSIAESMPKPISAIEPAAIPAGDRDPALEAHPDEAEPGERLRLAGGAEPFLRRSGGGCCSASTYD